MKRPAASSRSHLWYLLFWPVYLLRYVLIENLNPARTYHPIHCVLDDVIPFREEFVVFYVLWYAAFFGMAVYTLVRDVDAFRRYSRFLMVSMSVSTAIFLLYPSCQLLRPETFPRDNALTRLVGLLYALDTNTNVFPSEHAIGALAVLAAAANTPSLHTPRKLLAFAVLTLCISLSTVFLKQHSVLDVLAALPICALAYWLCYERREKP